jgi:hypothetical protein
MKNSDPATKSRQLQYRQRHQLGSPAKPRAKAHAQKMYVTGKGFACPDQAINSVSAIRFAPTYSDIQDELQYLR